MIPDNIQKLRHEPYENVMSGPIDVQGWRTDQPVLYDNLREGGVFAEVGVWKGYTAIEMAKRSKGHVVAIDHFRGSPEHFLKECWRGQLPGLYDQFRRNVIEEGLTEQITPLPLDSEAAFQVCQHHGIRFDLIHIDGAHEEGAVLCDLMRWGRLTHALVLDDYHKLWPGVVSAADFFAKECGWEIKDVKQGKALLEYID